MDVSKFIDAEKGLIKGEIFHSQEIYEEELEQVFARSWCFLAHDSMIPEPGDFMQNYIGEDPVLVVRQEDGSVKAFLNQCRHRGMRLCRADLGNAKNFMCSFHGWNYGIDGELINAPHSDQIYESLDPDVFRATQVRLANYKGFIFGTWDKTVADFEEYLGDFAWYFDAYVDRFEGGMEVVGVHKWVLPANWKFNAEQPSSDMYHGEVSHGSAFQVMVPLSAAGAPPPWAMEQLGKLSQPAGYQFTAPNGHGTGWFNGGMPLMDETILKWHQSTETEVSARLGADRFAIAGHANIFPTFMMLSNYTFRVTHPRGPDEMEIWAWSMAPKNAAAEVKEAIRLDLLRTFSPAGMFEQDDAVNWEEEQRIMRGHMARKKPLVYQQMLGRARYDADGLPGKTVPHVYAEEAARGMYQHYADLMSGKPWPDLEKLKKAREQRERAELAAAASPAPKAASGGSQ
ncbi:MAG: aromatic ring-hydroxylating dioxygenase subunit alpha [Gammaproteobacteria bacterium]|nr:MAG: aromatic ring-hydroxylating dioxygenase subunit alpha [Gammaproteobacteria bacterium]